MAVVGMARIIFVLACSVALSACAVSRSEIAVAVPKSENPSAGVTVGVQPVIDNRRFEVSPAEPSTPSLKEPGEVADKTITARALGRKRNSFGTAMGDVLLASPQTAAGLVGDAVKGGLRDAGYRVVESDDPAYAAAPKVTVRINEFWTWVTPGFSTIKLDHAANVSIQGDLAVVRSPATLTARESKGFFAITESEWAPVILAGLEQLRQQVRSLFAARTAGTSPPTSIAVAAD